MILVTGGAGFIGSAFVWQLNESGREDIIICDHLGRGNKWKNLIKRKYSRYIAKEDLFDWLKTAGRLVNFDAIIHLGACSNTTESDVDYLMSNNLNFTLKLWDFCTESHIPFIYASSAATYGNGALGFDDSDSITGHLKPLNPYGYSKLKFDQFAINSPKSPPFWAGLRFFNVFGPGEYHKGPQASVLYHFLPQIREKKSINLFKSYDPNFKDGEQKRDFIYVKDATKIMKHFFDARGVNIVSGVYNVGTGTARTFNDVAHAAFHAFGINDGQLQYIPMPANIKDQYQYFTEAKMSKIKENGKYLEPLTNLEDGVRDYFQSYLLTEDPYL